MTHVDIRKVIELPPQLLILEKEAVAQGFRFVTRLIDDWESGNNRFDAQGECLMGAFLNDDLVGIGGVSRDLRTQSNTGRLRRVYIAGSYRGQGIGRILVERLGVAGVSTLPCLALVYRHFKWLCILRALWLPASGRG